MHQSSLVNYASTQARGLVPRGVKQSGGTHEDAGSSKVASLAELLKGEQEQQSEVMRSQGGTEERTARHSKPLTANDTGYRKLGSSLGDFRLLSSQMTQLNNNAARAMELSTLESKKELSRLTGANSSGLASQFGLMEASKRQVKRRTKVSRLGAQTPAL